MGSIPNIFTWKVGNMRLAQRGEKRAELRGSGDSRGPARVARGAQGRMRESRSFPSASPPAAPAYARSRCQLPSQETPEREEKAGAARQPRGEGRTGAAVSPGSIPKDEPEQRGATLPLPPPKCPTAAGRRDQGGGEQAPPLPPLPWGDTSENNFFPTVSLSFQLI